MKLKSPVRFHFYLLLFPVCMGGSLWSLAQEEATSYTNAILEFSERNYKASETRTVYLKEVERSLIPEEPPQKLA